MFARFSFKLEDLGKELYYEGYNMTIRQTLKVRQIFFSTNSTLINFDLNKVSSNLTKAWINSLSHMVNFQNALVNATAIEKNLYFDDK